jgi:hypothetical protein
VNNKYVQNTDYGLVPIRHNPYLYLKNKESYNLNFENLNYKSKQHQNLEFYKRGYVNNSGSGIYLNTSNGVLKKHNMGLNSFDFDEKNTKTPNYFSIFETNTYKEDCSNYGIGSYAKQNKLDIFDNSENSEDLIFDDELTVDSVNYFDNQHNSRYDFSNFENISSSGGYQFSKKYDDSDYNYKEYANNEFNYLNETVGDYYRVSPNSESKNNENFNNNLKLSDILNTYALKTTKKHPYKKISSSNIKNKLSNDSINSKKINYNQNYSNLGKNNLFGKINIQKIAGRLDFLPNKYLNRLLLKEEKIAMFTSKFTDSLDRKKYLNMFSLENDILKNNNDIKNYL